MQKLNSVQDSKLIWKKIGWWKIVGLRTYQPTRASVRQDTPLSMGQFLHTAPLSFIYINYLYHNSIGSQQCLHLLNVKSFTCININIPNFFQNFCRIFFFKYFFSIQNDCQAAILYGLTAVFQTQSAPIVNVPMCQVQNWFRKNCGFESISSENEQNGHRAAILNLIMTVFKLDQRLKSIYQLAKYEIDS